MFRLAYLGKCTLGILAALSLTSNVAFADSAKTQRLRHYWMERERGLQQKAHDAIADQAKKNLEAAGYEVTLITEGTAEQIKAAIKDPTGQALVFVDHGATSEERIVGKKDGAKDRVFGTDFTGTFENYKVVTLHACGQNQDTWKAKFPKADFFSWTGCSYTDDELAWEKNKKYKDAQTPGGPKQEDIELSPLLTSGNFKVVDGDSVPVDPLFGGNWLMDLSLLPSLVVMTTISRYVTRTPILTKSSLVQISLMVIWSPMRSMNSHRAQTSILSLPTTNLSKALMNPSILLDANVLNQSVFIENLHRILDQQVIFAGIRQRIRGAGSYFFDALVADDWGADVDRRVALSAQAGRVDVSLWLTAVRS